MHCWHAIVYICADSYVCRYRPEIAFRRTQQSIDIQRLYSSMHRRSPKGVEAKTASYDKMYDDQTSIEKVKAEGNISAGKCTLRLESIERVSRNFQFVQGVPRVFRSAVEVHQVGILLEQIPGTCDVSSFHT